MASRYLMALDAGGGGGHCLLVEVESGKATRAVRAWTHPTAPGTGGLGSDLELDEIWDALADAARETVERAGARAEEIVGIAATSMRHTTILIDAGGKALLATTNRDGRAFGEALAIDEKLGAELYERTGRWPIPLASAFRGQWLANNSPESWKSAATMFSLSDWIAYRLSGEIATDPSQAEETLLLDIHTCAWAPDLAKQLSIPRTLLPQLLPAGTRLGSVREDVAAAFGLQVGTPVAVGGGDTQCGLLGTGTVAVGQAAAIAGTTAPVQLVVGKPTIDPERCIWTGCHVVPGLWVLESNAGPVGEALDWFAHLLYPEATDPVAFLLAEAGLSHPGASGMLSTFGAQVMNARRLELPTGNLTLSHLTAQEDPERRCHLVRSVIEGMAYAFRANLEQAAELGRLDEGALALAGGMSRSAIFAQLVSDTTGTPVEVGATTEATALGAAICAGVGAGIYADLAEGARALVGGRKTFQPDAARHKTYDGLYADWQKLRLARAAADSLAADLMLPQILARKDESSAATTVATRPDMLVTADMDEAGLRALRKLGEVEYASFRQAMRLLTGASLVKAMQGKHVLVTEVDIVDARAIEQLPDLRVIVSCRGDAVNVDVEACSAFGIPILNAPGRNAGAVADLTLAFLLMLARQLPQASAFLRQPGMEAGDTGRMGQAFGTLQGRELWCKTIGLVGMGAVGRGVARRAKAFGARVIAFDPYVSDEQATLAGVERVSLDALLEQSDFVSLHAPVTTETSGVIDTARFAQMKQGAFFINTARAALVDESALIGALQSGKLAGAALDVFSVEPPGSDHPLLALANVVGTPHVGGNTIDIASHQGRIISEDLARLLNGERPRHILNPDVLEAFDWNAARPQPDPTTLAALSKRPGPAVTDLQRDRGATKHSSAAAPAPSPADESAPAMQASPEIAEKMGRLVRVFLTKTVTDPAVLVAVGGQDVSLHFTLAEVGVSFSLRFAGGTASFDFGADEDADVALKMSPDVFDGMFTGRVNPMQAAMSGGLSFSGDTSKAMTLQDLQEDLSRLYAEARAEAGDPGDLASLTAAPGASRTAATTASIPADAAGVRVELIRAVNELYAQELITATGGNVSARTGIGEDQLWITPSQLFKGDLRPEILVRIGLDGESLDSGSLSPSSERLMHCAVYRARPDAQAAVHAHAAHATILANAGLPFLPISTEAAFFGDIPRIPFIMPGSQELADAIEEALRNSWAVLMQNHGLLVAGRTLRRAADMVEIIDRSAQVLLGCYALQKEPPTLPPEIVAKLQKIGDILA